jgi:hypothetical protein
LRPALGAETAGPPERNERHFAVGDQYEPTLAGGCLGERLVERREGELTFEQTRSVEGRCRIHPYIVRARATASKRR